MKARTSSMEDALVDAFLLSIPSNCSDDLLNPVPTIAPRQVRRALDYIHANSHTQISPEFLAELCGVSMRSLQYSFKNFVGYSISDYQIRLRTQRAKEELMANADLPVYLVAQKWASIQPVTSQAISAACMEIRLQGYEAAELIRKPVRNMHFSPQGEIAFYQINLFAHIYLNSAFFKTALLQHSYFIHLINPVFLRYLK